MSRKQFIRIALVLVGMLIVAAVPLYNVFSPTLRQMRAGKKYMDALTDLQLQSWIDRSKTYLATADPKEHPIGARPVPADLQALKIQRIDLRTNSVVYVWTGGLDHTCLTVRTSNGRYEVIAMYDDHHSKVLWPKATAPAK